MRLSIVVAAVTSAGVLSAASVLDDQVPGVDHVPPPQTESTVDPSAAGHLGCGCGEGKLARVAQATHDFSTRVDTMDKDSSDLTAALNRNLAEVPSIAAQYRTIASAAQAALAAGSDVVTVYRENNAVIQGLHEAAQALISAFEQTWLPQDQALAELEEACRQRQPPADASMSPEVREWSSACARVAEVGARYRSDARRWQSAAQELKGLDQQQWQAWRAVAERIGDAQ